MTMKQTNAYKIFNYRYRCMVPRGYLVSAAEVDTYGVISRGSVEADKNIPLELQDVNLTINEMVELRRKGAPIDLCNTTDAVPIYDIICGHLRDHIEHRRGSSRAQAPLQDLVDLDELAAAVWRVARVHVNIEMRNHDLITKLKSMSVFDTPQEEANVEKEHAPLTNMMNIDYLGTKTW